MRAGVPAAGTLAIAGALAAERIFRRKYESWGALGAEVQSALPGDDLVPSPNRSSTRAVTVEAPPDRVWPWLAQIGHARGGLYSYDRLENLVGCQLHSADSILLQHQDLNVGDLVRMGPEGYPAFSVAAVEREQHLVLVSADTHTGEPTTHSGSPTASTWQWSMVATGNRTRLISRQRLAYPPRELPMWFIVQPIAFVMERKMLMGIKARAEGALPG
jgi:hypothetical protein